MRRVPLFAPFTSGMLTDQPDYQIGPQNSSYAQDGFSPTGFFKQRGGWAYEGTTGEGTDLSSVYRAQFALSDVTRTILSTSTGAMYIHNPSASGTLLVGGLSEQFVFRCVYRDQLIGCYQDGVKPMKLYSGAPAASITSSGTWQSAANVATMTGGTFASTPGAGTYFNSVSYCGSPRILEGNSVSSVTIEDLLASSNGVSVSGATASATGTAITCVGIYSAGTVTTTTSTVTGTGTKFTDAGVVSTDNILFIPSGSDSQISVINTVTSNTALAVVTSAISTGCAYQILRACPFKDAAAHKNSLWGTGVAQYPNRVYVSPPNWNPAMPPGFEVPFDPITGRTSENANDYMLDFIDVPAPYDGDHNVAILSSPNPLLVLKRHAVYGVYGSFGSVSVDMIADGIGCIDIRSAQSFDEGQFWAGEGGIYWYVNGTVVDLTAGKINREWRALTRDFDYGTSDYCSIGIASGHLIVHITTGAGTTQRTYLCDLRDQSWQSRLSNVTPRYMFSSRINGEAEKLYAVSDARQGRVLNLAPMLNGAGTAKDDAGSAPRLQAYTTSALAQLNGIEGFTRFVDLDVFANVVDAGAAGSTQLDVSVVSGGGIGNEADSTDTVTSIDSDTVDRIDRHSNRVSRKGRFHQVRFAVDPLGTDTSATKVEIHQIATSFRALPDNS